MTELSEAQAADFIPPEVEKTLVIGVDSTSRAYDLSAIDLGTKGSEVTVNKNQWIYVTLLADGAAVFWAFSENGSRTISDTAEVAAGDTPSFANTRCWKCPDGTEQSRRIDRGKHRYLYLKTASGTARMRIQVSSCPPPGAILP